MTSSTPQPDPDAWTVEPEVSNPLFTARVHKSGEGYDITLARPWRRMAAGDVVLRGYLVPYGESSEAPALRTVLTSVLAHLNATFG